MTLKQVLGMLSELSGRPAPRWRVPVSLALAAAYVDQLVEDVLLRRRPRIPLEGARMARKPMWVDCSKAVRELGLPQRPVKEALRQAVEWFTAEGYVPGAGAKALSR